MISAVSIMRPLPVGPVDGIRNLAAPHPTARPPRLMQPLAPVQPRTIAQPKPGAVELGDAIRNAAFQRMLDRLDVKDLGTVTDPTA